MDSSCAFALPFFGHCHLGLKLLDASPLPPPHLATGITSGSCVTSGVSAAACWTYSTNFFQHHHIRWWTPFTSSQSCSIAGMLTLWIDRVLYLRHLQVWWRSLLWHRRWGLLLSYFFWWRWQYRLYITWVFLLLHAFRKSNQKNFFWQLRRRKWKVIDL